MAQSETIAKGHALPNEVQRQPLLNLKIKIDSQVDDSALSVACSKKKDAGFFPSKVSGTEKWKMLTQLLEIPNL